MVLRGKLRGRVGSRRDYLTRARESILFSRAFVIYHFSPRLRVSDMTTANWIKRLGFWGLMFFLVKGLLWLLVPALAVYLVN